MKIFLLVLLLLAPMAAYAADPATPTLEYDQAKATPWLAQPIDPTLNKRLEVAYHIVSAADIVTTCASGKLPGVVEESAVAVRLVGHHPSCAQDLTLGLGRSALHVAGTWLLTKVFHAPAWVVLSWQGGTTAAESVAVAGNLHLLEEYK